MFFYSLNITGQCCIFEQSFVKKNICNDFQVIYRPSVHTKIIMGQNSINNVGRVKIFVLCILSVDIALYLYNISSKYFAQNYC